MNVPIITVVIPTHNRAALLFEAVRSVLDQGFSDREIIVVDDGSTDETPAVAGAFGDAIRYVRQENRGPGAARNHGIRLARGRYVAFLDSDDLFLPGKLAAQVACFEERPETGLVYTACRVIDDGGQGTPETYPAYLFGPVYLDIAFGCSLPTPSVMVRADVLAETGGFSEQLRWAEDLDLWRRIARRHPIVALKDALTAVRRHSGNRRPDPTPVIRDVLSFAEQAREQDPQLDDLFCRRGAANLYLYYAREAIRYARETPEKAAGALEQARMLALRTIRLAPRRPSGYRMYAETCLPNAWARVPPLARRESAANGLRRGLAVLWRQVALRVLAAAAVPEAWARLRVLRREPAVSGLRLARFHLCARLSGPVARALAFVESSGGRRLALVGVSETAVLTRLCARGRRLAVTDVFDDAWAGRVFMGLRVRPTAELRSCWADHVMVTGVTAGRAGAELDPGTAAAIPLLARSAVWRSRVIWPLGGLPVAMPPEVRDAIRRATGHRPSEPPPAEGARTP